eukprot:TRINITY_DN11314_c0_g1_i4.p3 TRINITY_DN11314_c0_g1~~TRINITY_DN11314_c0_g1_i4.p3  ORF type:complete len:106 (-),score=0.06 TRINITY_DN11314_c0_g1_i4:1638-1955(-)
MCMADDSSFVNDKDTLRCPLALHKPTCKRAACEQALLEKLVGYVVDHWHVAVLLIRQQVENLSNSGQKLHHDVTRAANHTYPSQCPVESGIQSNLGHHKLAHVCD